ncbi:MULTISPECIES: autotransporter outer membrane beta-barrel domain-containing protein [Pseudomonas]|uniref:autotransporter outer membrane beta-barrel domain-containing protein n=1 Tax=Pseudomonas TaxID=286 RepID=UPI000CFC9987|nr:MULTISPECIES: autotransporter outer membrane beta-barrel domain-containing protein [Pseudomonas]PQZ91459.1 hypothetical protein CQ048_13310 [Pseudomonas trivialis]PRB27049.1 hypothetical protein CQ041_10065 [Pseudomonas sp. MYb60]
MNKSLLAISIAFSVTALAQSPAFAAHSDIRDQIIETLGDEAPVVAAKDGDTLTVTNVDLISSGLHSVGVLADGAGSLVTYQGGTINTSGRTSHALSAHDGAQIQADNLTIHTTGTLARGIQAETGSRVEVSNSSIQVDGGVGGNTTAGAAATGGSVIILNDTSVLATGQGSVGIMTTDASSAVMNGGSVTTTNTVSDAVLVLAGGGNILLNDVAVSTAGSYSRGVLAGGADSVIAVNGGSITTRGINAEGARAGTGGRVSLTGTQVQTLGAQSVGLQALFAGLIDAVGVNITTAGDRSAGVSAESVGSLVKFEDGAITTAGMLAEGAKSLGGGTVQLANVAVSTSGAFSRALVAEGNGSTVVADRVVIDTRGGQSYGLLAFGSGSQVTFTRGKITTHGAASHGVSVYGGGEMSIASSEIDASGHGATMSDGGLLRIDGSRVTANGSGNNGLMSWATTGTDNRFEVNGSELISNAGAAISARGDGSHTFVINNSVIDGQGGVLFDLTRATPAVPNTGNSSVIASGSVLKGDIDVTTDPDFVADFSLQNATHWTGAGQGINQLALGGASVWQMTGNSSIQSLDLQDGRVNFDHADGQFKTLTTDKLAGTGSFQMNTNLATLEGDLLVVSAANGATGNHTLFIEDSGVSPKNASDVLRVVDTHGGDAQFGLYGGHVDAGAFRYTLGKDGDDWFLSNAGGANPGPQDLSKGANAAIAAHTAGAAMWTSQMDALVKRLGELRMGKDEGGVWTRAIGKQFDVSEKSSRAYQQNISGVEIGADTAIALNRGKVYVGGMVGTAKSDLNFGEGASGEIDSKMLGAYATYLDDSGVYVDSVFKYNRLNNQIKTPTNLGNPVKASYDTNGIGASVEVGKHIALESGWFVEPQVALTASRTQGARYTASNGLKVKTDDLDSLQSRVGSLFGRNIQLDNGMQAQPYVKASLITEHAGNSKVNVNGSRLDAELQGNRVELGFGGVVRVSANSKVSLDAEYAKGSAIEQPWGVTLGYRYSW